ncbi:MAG: TetR/AcrR family transcriptional regulator [Janthinobacterium lividum]
MNEIRPLSIFEAVAAPQATVSRKDAILAAATRVFLRLGFEGASMEAIAQEAAVVRRTLYNQFPEGKEAIFHAVTERVWDSYPIVDIVADGEALADPAIGLRRIGEAVAEFWAPAMAVSFLRLVIAEGARFPHLTRSFFDVGKTPAMKALTGYLDELARRGMLTIEDTELATRQFLGLIDEPLLWVRVVGQPEEVSLERRRLVVDQAVAMFLGHYRKA